MDSDNITSSALWQKICAGSLAYERSLDKLYRKQTGSYYTSPDLAYAMMQELVKKLDPVTRTHLFQKKFLEPCVGTGNFVFAYLRVCRELKFSRAQYLELLRNLYVCDVDQGALTLYQQNLTLLAQEWFGISLDIEYFRAHIGGPLLFDVHSDTIRYISLEESLSLPHTRFDLVVTNPPYKNLKAEQSHYLSSDEKAADHAKYKQIGKLSKQYFTSSTSGTLNLYKLFVEEILERYLAPDGVCSLLIPASILSDKSCSKLRTRLLEQCAVHSIRLIPEKSTYVDASQALCAILFQKGQHTGNVWIDKCFQGDLAQGMLFPLADMLDSSTGNAFLILSSQEYQLRHQMQQHPTIQQLSYIKNLRGELDVTLDKANICTDETPYRLLRGRHIGFYRINELPEKEYVRPSFLQKTAKKGYITAPRLVCQQIANMAKKRRLAFMLVPAGHVLANSCNFIALEPNPDQLDLYFLLGVLNSDLIEWYFGLTSSNNHINNYEIDNFPIPVHCAQKERISTLVQEYLRTSDEELLAQINALVHDAYCISSSDSTVLSDAAPSASAFQNPECIPALFQSDLLPFIPGVSLEACAAVLHGELSVKELYLKANPSSKSFDLRVLESLEKKYRALSHGFILNHTSFKLSDLDLEMIRPIPQGGSWKDIPASTVQKSKRLCRITQTGGRTTLYGRIDYTKPSYTITTYFNRPGNGTYVHPVHDRVLSVREAARFQSFPDNYLFCGNKSDMLKQVGNAVPVLLAYAIGRQIREKAECQTSVDLFSGAGGMTYGFKQAGIHAAIANDFAESACVTLKVNSPEIPVLCGDITADSVKQAIIQAGQDAQADIICGGPPCQGFSMAGYRMADDPRNQLFHHFADIVSAVKPKVIVFENVEGLLSYQGGETYRDIIALFSELGYFTEGRKLQANHYGVPQRRKRVILLCTRKDTGILPADLFPAEITPQEEQQITAYETLYDLEQVECSETAQYNSSYQSDYLRYLKHFYTAEEFFGVLSSQTRTASKAPFPSADRITQLSFL